MTGYSQVPDKDRRNDHITDGLGREPDDNSCLRNVSAGSRQRGREGSHLEALELGELWVDTDLHSSPNTGNCPREELAT